MPVAGEIVWGRQQMLTAADVASQLRRRSERHHTAFAKVLAAVHAKIRVAVGAARGAGACTHVVHQVPEFQLGHAVYDLGDCVAYVSDELRRAYLGV